jgi:hypothetical protein
MVDHNDVRPDGGDEVTPRDTLLALPTVRAAGVPLVAIPGSKILDELRLIADHLDDAGVPVHFVNAYTVSLTADERYLRLFQSDGLNIADGTPLAWIARRTSGQVAHLRGPDAFRELLSSDPSHGIRHFLLGGSDDSLARLESAIARDYPDAVVVGSFSPPFTDFGTSDRELIDSSVSGLPSRTTRSSDSPSGTPQSCWRLEPPSTSCPETWSKLRDCGAGRAWNGCTGSSVSHDASGDGTCWAT